MACSGYPWADRSVSWLWADRATNRAAFFGFFSFVGEGGNSCLWIFLRTPAGNTCFEEREKREMDDGVALMVACMGRVWTWDHPAVMKNINFIFSSLPSLSCLTDNPRQDKLAGCWLQFCCTLCFGWMNIYDNSRLETRIDRVVINGTEEKKNKIGSRIFLEALAV